MSPTVQDPAVKQQLDVLRKVEFDWAVRLSDVWNDAAWDVPELHANLRREFVDELESMAGESGVSPLGWVITGSGGSGKTHLLGTFRREAARRGAAFVLVDMTDVRDFWETVLQGYLGSLQVPYEGELFQHQCILRSLVDCLGRGRPAADALAALADRKLEDLARDTKSLLGTLFKTYPKQVNEYQNAIRALACLNSSDFSIANTGMTWLQGQPVDSDEQKAIGFTREREEPRKIVAALSWIMGLCGPTVLAFDQLDPIVTQLGYQELGESDAEEKGKAKSIIAEIGGGLGALDDTLRRTLVVVSCVESTWDRIRHTVLATSVDRFEEPRPLMLERTEAIAESVARNRLAPAYRAVEFKAPYETWPFKPEFFARFTASTPREVLKRCEDHRKACLRSGSVREILEPGTGGGPGPRPNEKRLEARFSEAMASADPAHLVEEKREDERLAPLLQSALQCLIWEREHERPDQVDAEIDTEFAGGSTTRPLHARVRLIFHAEQGREEHYCVRALQLTNARAYQNRLNAAMVQAGIDRDLKFRHLSIVRTNTMPGGKVSERLTQKFEAAGGQFVAPSDDDVRTLWAIHQLKQEGDPDFRDWLRDRRPISAMTFIRQAVPSPLLLGRADGDGAGTDETGQKAEVPPEGQKGGDGTAANGDVHVHEPASRGRGPPIPYRPWRAKVRKPHPARASRNRPPCRSAGAWSRRGPARRS